MTVPAALQDPHLRRFRLRRHRIHVAGGQLSMVTPASSDSLLVGAGGEHCQQVGELPYWAELWPASVGLARTLMRGPDLAGRRVMDLGCGLGLAGVAAGCRGAEVLFADREPDALRFARFNARHNGVRGASSLRLDWRHQTAPGGFDLLCLSDVTYAAANHAPLLRHLRHCLRAGGAALVADPYRDVAGEFLDTVASEFDMETVATDTFFAGRRSPLRLAWVRQP